MTQPFPRPEIPGAADAQVAGPVTFTDHGAHLLSADSATGELFYLSADADYSPGSSIRGGVPVIAPWFNDLIEGREPAHGWARRRQWNHEPHEDGYDAWVTWRGLRLVLTVRGAADSLSVGLDVLNRGITTQPVQLALHPYFAVSDVTQVMVARADGRTYEFDGTLVDSREPHAAVGGPTRIIDRAGGREIAVFDQGADHTVVWNPGEADAPGDLDADGWRRFVCVEPARLGTRLRGFALAPGQSATIGMRVETREL